MEADDGRIVVISGDSRCGKTAYTYNETRRFRRVLVFDIEAQWCERAGFRAITSRAELVKAVQKSGAAKLAYIPNGHDLKGEFEFWAECAYFWGRWRGECAIVGEELADVSTPAKAPPYWGMLCRRGMKRSITIFAISQRWAEADKTVMGNASEFVAFIQATADDAEYMAKKTRIPLDDINNLKAYEWIKYDKESRKLTKGGGFKKNTPKS